MNRIQADAIFQQAQQALAAGRPDEALALCHAALAQDGSHAQAQYLLAVLLFQGGDAARAVAALRQALSLEPALPDGYYNLGAMLQASGRLDEAEAAYRREIALRPDSVRARGNLAALLGVMGHAAEAEALYRAALALDADFLPAQKNLAQLLQEAGRVDEAETWYRRIVGNDPGNALAHNNLGAILKDSGRLPEAEQALRRALAEDAHCAEAWMNLGLLLQETARDGEAETCYRRALAEAPDMSEARYNFACLLLQQGRFDPGWREFESRVRIQGNADGWRHDAPRWDGKAGLEGKTVILTAEQGLGDSLQFLRYAGMTAARGARVILALQPPLKPLAVHCPGVAAVYAFGENLPDADYQCPLMSLPLAFSATVDTIPAAPYLFPGADAVTRWHARLGERRGGLRVGLVWAGNPRMGSRGAAMNRRRSLHFDQLRPLFDIAGVQFFSLQVGDAARQCDDARVADRSADLHDFNETAALVMQLDLVISVDTAVAHLAGGLGQRVWLLDRYDSCWRWMRERSDSPWYPRMRIFRQSAPGDWAGVVADVVAALRQEPGV